MSNEQNSSALDRRTVLKGAAWSVPVVAAAVAAPLAAASVNNASVAWTGTETGLLTLRLLDGASLITAQALVTVPNEFTIANGDGAINQTATVSISVGRPAGINIPVGRARGFGVANVAGVEATDANRTVEYQSAPVIGRYGFPATTYTGTHNISIDSNGSLQVPVEFGLAGDSTGVSVSLLAAFPVTLNVDFGGGASYTATSSISVPVGAGIL